MPPKTSKELREQAERENDEERPPAEGKSRTAEGLETRNPSRREFFSNLEKAAKEQHN